MKPFGKSLGMVKRIDKVVYYFRVKNAGLNFLYPHGKANFQKNAYLTHVKKAV